MNSPSEPSADRTMDASPDGCRAIGAFIALPIAGGALGFFGYIAAAIFFDSQIAQSEPGLSYGQQSMLISLPLCMLILGATGFASAFLLVRRDRVAVGLLLFTFFSGAGVTALLWLSQIARYGRDSNEYVLYLSPLAFSLIALGVAAIIAWFSFASGDRDRT